jgi:hypothetical protein
MRRIGGDALAGCRIDPAIVDAPAAKHEGMRVAALDYR